jgi:hypothetical protein
MNGFTRAVRPLWILAGLVSFLALLPAGLNAEDDPVISAAEAREYIGALAMVCGVVADAYYAQTTNGRPTYLNFDKPFPDAEFTAVVWEEDREAFPYSPEALEGLKICVYGKISRYKGRPQMKLIRPEQVGRSK